MSYDLPRLAVAVLAIVVAAPVAASAQIYTWKDSSGHTVLSNRPKDGAVTTFAVAPASGFLTTRRPTRQTDAYDRLIADHSAEHGVNPELVRAVIQAESAFNPRARSVKGAMGLMQLMPATARELGVSDAYDPAQNIRGGVAYLKRLLVRYSPSVELALAAYNAGPGAVEKYGAVPPYRETRDYVAKIRGATLAHTPQPTRLYKTIEIVNGRPVPRYSNVPSKDAEIVKSPNR